MNDSQLVAAIQHLKDLFLEAQVSQDIASEFYAHLKAWMPPYFCKFNEITKVLMVKKQEHYPET